MNKIPCIYLSLLILVCHVSSAHGQITEEKIDALTWATMDSFKVPGMAVGIIKDNKIMHAKGYGVESLNRIDKVTDKTLFGIASNSKAFTCFALAMLVDEQKIKWDDKVRKYIPEFTLSDAYVSESFTIKDLVIHRGGLGLGAGDLMFFPEGGHRNAMDIIKGLKHLPFKSSFRSTFEYNNNFYIVAGEVIRSVSGLSWEEFIEQRILAPVGMVNSKASYNRVAVKKNIIDAHAPVFENNSSISTVKAIPHDWSDVANPAGGIMSNIQDMLVWAKFLMNEAVTDSGKRLLSKEQLHELWSLQMPIPIAVQNPYKSSFNGYSLGWFVSDVYGHKQLTHTGGLLGTVTQFTYIPDLKLGIVVLTNQQSGAAFSTITNTIKDSYLGIEDRKWLQQYSTRMRNYNAKMDSTRNATYNQIAKSTNQLADKQITGTYKDVWFGDIIIAKKQNELIISCVKSPKLVGKLKPYNNTTYVAIWDDRSFDADAFVSFTLDEKGMAQSFTMKPIADITDFSFDFQDLHPIRVRE